MGTRWAGRGGFCLVFFVVRDHTEGSTAAYASSERQLVRQPIQSRRVQRANGPSSVPDMTGLSAGGLRSRRRPETTIRQTNDSGRLGADFALRLEQANSPGNESNSGQPSHSVLGQGPFNCRTTEQAAAHEAAHLLPALRNTLGFSRSLSERHEVE